MTQERFFELVYAWKDGDLTGDELYQRLYVSPAVKQSEQLCGNLDKNLECRKMCLTHCIDGNKFWK